MSARRGFKMTGPNCGCCEEESSSSRAGTVIEGTCSEHCEDNEVSAQVTVEISGIVARPPTGDFTSFGPIGGGGNFAGGDGYSARCPAVVNNQLNGLYTLDYTGSFSTLQFGFACFYSYTFPTPLCYRFSPASSGIIGMEGRIGRNFAGNVTFDVSLLERVSLSGPSQTHALLSWGAKLSTTTDRINCKQLNAQLNNVEKTSENDHVFVIGPTSYWPQDGYNLLGGIGLGAGSDGLVLWHTGNAAILHSVTE